MKKAIILLSIFPLICGCSETITKVNLTYGISHASNSVQDVFSHELYSYSEYKKKYMNEESYIMYIYDNGGCECYTNLLRISADIAYESDYLIYTMNVKVMENENTYGFSTSGHTYPSICIFENGYKKYQVNYDDKTYFKDQTILKEYLSLRVNKATQYIHIDKD